MFLSQYTTVGHELFILNVVAFSSQRYGLSIFPDADFSFNQQLPFCTFQGNESELNIKVAV